MLTITNKKGKVLKEVFVIRRIEVTKGEHAGRIVHIVRSVKLVKGQWEQNDYQVITFNDQDGRVTCGCPASGDCCHKTESASYDMRRYNSIQPQVIAQPVIETAATKQMWDFEHDESYQAPNEEVSAETLALIAADTTPLNLDEPLALEQPPVWMKPEQAIKPVPTPQPRKVSQDWLLGNRRNAATFSGTAA
jgi:hypothetical protein